MAQDRSVLEMFTEEAKANSNEGPVTPAALKRAYIKFSKELHPDKHPGKEVEMGEKFQEMDAIYKAWRLMLENPNLQNLDNASFSVYAKDRNAFVALVAKSNNESQGVVLDSLADPYLKRQVKQEISAAAFTKPQKNEEEERRRAEREKHDAAEKMARQAEERRKKESDLENRVIDKMKSVLNDKDRENLGTFINDARQYYQNYRQAFSLASSFVAASNLLKNADTGRFYIHPTSDTFTNLEKGALHLTVSFKQVNGKTYSQNFIAENGKLFLKDSGKKIDSISDWVNEQIVAAKIDLLAREDVEKFKNLKREEAAQYLQSNNQADFVIRPSTLGNAYFAISVKMHDDQISNGLIKFENGRMYVVDEKNREFQPIKSVTEFVNKTKKDYLETQKAQSEAADFPNQLTKVKEIAEKMHALGSSNEEKRKKILDFVAALDGIKLENDPKSVLKTKQALVGLLQDLGKAAQASHESKWYRPILKTGMFGNYKDSKIHTLAREALKTLGVVLIKPEKPSIPLKSEKHISEEKPPIKVKTPGMK